MAEHQVHTRRCAAAPRALELEMDDLIDVRHGTTIVALQELACRCCNIRMCGPDIVYTHMQVTVRDTQLAAQLEEFRQYKIRAQTVLRHKTTKEDPAAPEAQRQVACPG